MPPRKTNIPQEGMEKMTISEAIPHLSLNSREKFVCLRVFNAKEQHTLEDWKKLLEQKKIR